MNKNSSSVKCEHCAHYNRSPEQKAKEESEIQEDKPTATTTEQPQQSANMSKTMASSQKGGNADPKGSSKVETKKQEKAMKPKVHSDCYCESTTYTASNGHYKKEEHAEHKVNGKVVYKKDLWDNDGEVVGKQIDWDKEGHKHIKPIGFEERN